MDTKVTLKIRNTEITYDCFYTANRDSYSLTIPEIAALRKVHMDMVKKAWTPLVGALETTGTLPEDIATLISYWAMTAQLGDRCKKTDTLGRKILKGKIEEKLTEERYSVKEARDTGLIDRTMEEYVAGGNPLWMTSLKEAEKEIDILSFLDPLPITAEEMETLRGELIGFESLPNAERKVG